MRVFPQHRPVTMARRGMVAAPHYLAAQAGLDMLKAGGNAIDAAIATNAVLQVVYPFLCGLGGDAFMLIFHANDNERDTSGLYGLNGSGRSAQTASIARYHELGYTAMPTSGIHSVTVPGCVSAWGAAEERFGRLGLARVLEPAIAYAEDGFAVGPGLHAALNVRQSKPLTTTDHSWHAHFLPTGSVPPVGSVMRFPTLAHTLRTIAQQGPQAFYQGELAEQIAAFFSKEGGLITRNDLATHKSAWVTPLSIPFADLRIYELPPNTQGVTALQMLGMLDGLPLAADPLSPDIVHLAVEAKKLAFADRAAHLTDPVYMQINPETLLEPSYLTQQRMLIDPAHARPSLTPGNVSGDTVYTCAADSDGNVVSLIQSNYMGFGSGFVVDNTGIVLQNRGASFSLDSKSMNALAPAKRPLHTLIPSMALRNGRPAIVFGTMGGDGQAQFHLQVYTALVHFGLNIQQALGMPRWVHGRINDGEEALLMEGRYPAATMEALRQRGHNVHALEPWTPAVGHAHGIIFDSSTGVMHGGSDPRAEGIAAGW